MGVPLLLFLLIIVSLSMGAIVLVAVYENKLGNLNKKLKLVTQNTRDKLEGEYQYQFLKRMEKLRSAFSQSNTQQLSDSENAAFKTVASWLGKQVCERYDKLGKNLRGDIVAETQDLNSKTIRELNRMVWAALQQYREDSQGGYSIHPKGTRIAYSEGNRTVVLIEQEPCVRRVLFTKESGQKKGSMPNTAKGRHQYNIAFPYIYYFFIADNGNVGNMSIYFAKKPITSNKDLLYILPFPNVEGSDRYSRICMGSGAWHNGGSMDDQCRQLIDLFWRQSFGSHGEYRAHLTGDERLKSLAAWEKASKEDPTFPLSISWRNGHSVNDIITAAMGKRSKTTVDHGQSDVQKLLDKHNKELDDLLKAITSKVKKKDKPEVVALEVERNAKGTVKDVLTVHAQACFGKCRKQASEMLLLPTREELEASKPELEGTESYYDLL